MKLSTWRKSTGPHMIPSVLNIILVLEIGREALGVVYTMVWGALAHWDPALTNWLNECPALTVLLTDHLLCGSLHRNCKDRSACGSSEDL